MNVRRNRTGPSRVASGEDYFIKELIGRKIKVVIIQKIKKASTLQYSRTLRLVTSVVRVDGHEISNANNKS